jgi:hypothetical protein
MKQNKIDLLKMQHARYVAEMSHYIAQANRETALGEWRCNWSVAIDQSAAAAMSIESKLDELISEDATTL